MTVTIPATFMTSIRADIRDIATIAKFFAYNNFVLPSQTKGVLALHAYRMLGDHIRKINSKYGVEGTEEAIEVLRTLGYGESAVPGRRDYIPILKQMSRENLETEGCQSYIKPLTEERRIAETKAAEELSAARELARTHKLSKKKESINIADTAGIKEVLAPEPESESPQLKIRTANDEKKDISRLRTAMSNFSGAPVLEENTGRAGQ